MKEEYLKIRAESLNAPKPEIKISDEDFLRKIFEYVKASFLVFKGNYQKPRNLSKINPKFLIKKKNNKTVNINEKFVEWLADKNFFEADELFKFMIDMRGFNKLPKIVSDEEASVIEQNGVILYRGADKNDFYANLLTEKSNYHYGHGLWSNGIFAASLISSTKEYTTLNKDKMPLKLYLGDNGFEVNSLFYVLDYIKYKKVDSLADMFLKQSEEIQVRIGLLYDAYHKLTKSVKEYIYEVVRKNIGLLAIFLGYDYIYTIDYHITCILNRGSMFVSQSEYDRVVKGTKYEVKNETELASSLCSE